MRSFLIHYWIVAHVRLGDVLRSHTPKVQAMTGFLNSFKVVNTDLMGPTSPTTFLGSISYLAKVADV